MDTNIGLDFYFPEDPEDATKTIKVIGIGGGGVNAVNYMYKNSSIHGVRFAVCNTDEQSFNGVDVPVKVTLGDGLGSGGKPGIAKQEFEKSIAEVEQLLDDGTKMVFIASGMGGGTGSGAGPLLAKMAKEKGILTVGIVTIPFLFEKVPRIIQALDAVEEMSRNVDALIVINNERLKKRYPEFDIDAAFAKPDEVLAMAVKSIAEIITVKGVINRDFNDVVTTMKDGGVALVSYGFGKGENRLDNAIQEALDSPLLNNNDIYNAKRVLLYITYRKDAHLTVEEVTNSNDNFMSRFDKHINMIWGFGSDDSLQDDQDVKFTIIATGFGLDAVPEIQEWTDENALLEAQRESDRRAKDEKRIKDVYGETLSATVKVNRVSPSSIVILTLDEMDDDGFLDFIGKTPTYNRKPKEIAAKRKPVKSVLAAKAPATATEAGGGGATIIEF
jgi:cell division protein FtsZ